MLFSFWLDLPPFAAPEPDRRFDDVVLSQHAYGLLMLAGRIAATRNLIPLYPLSIVMPRLWFEPVDIWISDSTRRTVTSVEEAARLLMEAWPGDATGSEPHMLAQRACLAALQSERPVAILAARAAFLKAAEEAGMG